MTVVKTVIEEAISEIQSPPNSKSNILPYKSVVTILDPSKSWLRKRIGLSKNMVPGAYAVEVHERY